MKLKTILLVAVSTFIAAFSAARANTLSPDLKAYDFCRAYSIEDGGVVIEPYNHGFYCMDGVKTAHGVRLVPGDTFMQFDGGRGIVDRYTFTRLNAEGNRAYFHQRTNKYTMEKDAKGEWQPVIGRQVATDDFFLTRFRATGWIGYLSPVIEIHPGAQGWRTRPQY